MEMVHHHRCPRVRGGSNEDCNLMHVNRKEETKMHTHEGVRVFHEKIIHALEWDGPIIIPEARQRLLGVIQEFGPELYERSAVKNFEKFAWNFDKKRGLYIPKPYDKQRYEG